MMSNQWTAMVRERGERDFKLMLHTRFLLDARLASTRGQGQMSGDPNLG
jgi:hypothetical protein